MSALFIVSLHVIATCIYVCVCVSVCTLWEVSEEDLSGKCNDVCSSAAELGHREVESEREKDTERKQEIILTAPESTG